MRLDPRILLNFVSFQVAWFACVLGGANDLAVAGTLTVVVAILLHLWMAPRPRPELALVMLVAAIGTVWDSLVVSLGLMTYPSGMFASGLAPHWIIAMWALFAITLNLSMGWLKGRPLVASVMGAIGGPLAYFAGYRLGGVGITDLALALGVQAVGWAVMMPLLAALAARLNGVDPEPVRVKVHGGRSV
jgi:hypothetical protein